MEKVSVLITTFNEIQHIEEVIESVEWADEIIVADSFSTDGTYEKAVELADRAEQHVYDSPAAQKNRFIPKAKHPWVLILDADERITPQLRDEIQELLRQKPKLDAYRIFRLNHFMGRRVRYSGWQSDSVIRLFRRDVCRYEEKQVHEEITYSGKVGVLRNRMLHYTFKDLSSYLKKMDRYTTWGAQDRIKKVKSVGVFHLFIKPTARFFRHYILRFGFLDGRIGLIVSGLSAYSVFIRNLKLMRMLEGEEISAD